MARDPMAAPAVFQALEKPRAKFPIIGRIIIALLIGVVLQMPAFAGYCLEFDGIDDYVSIVHDSAFNVTNVTMEMWFCWGNTTTPAAVEFLVGKGSEQLEIHTGGGSGEHGLRFIPTSGVYLDTPTNVFTPGRWHHIAFVYEPGSSLGKCYIDGVEQVLVNRGGQSVGAPIYTSESPLLLGRRYGDVYHLNGKLDEVRIWNIVRSQADIQANMHRELLGNESGLVAYYRMSDGSGATLTDDSANNHAGSISGATWESRAFGSIGPMLGGNTIAVAGSFGTVTNILVGDVPATSFSFDSGGVVFVVPAADRAGAVDVVIQSVGVESRLESFHTYNPRGRINVNAPQGWSVAENLPVASSDLGSAVFRDYWYVAGDSSTNVYRFDGESWDEVVGLPESGWGGAAVLNDWLYFFNDDVSAYRFDGVGWTAAPALPSLAMGTVVCEFNNHIYALGDWYAPGVVNRFDGATWTYDESLPVPRALMSLAVLNNGLYAIGGYDGYNPIDKVHRFDGSTWSEAAPLPYARYASSAAVLDGSIYVIGGHDGQGVRNNVYRFDGTTWTEVESLPIAVSASAAAAYEGFIYVTGGDNGQGSVNPTYRYALAESVGVSPAQGSWTGGYEVVIWGENLGNGADVTNVTICGVPATIGSQSSTQIVVTANVAAPGIGDVRVYSTSFGMSYRKNIFEYLREEQAPLVFTPVSPQVYLTTNQLSVSGGTGTGAVSYEVLSGPGALVTESRLVATGGTGTIEIRATKAQDAYYESVSVTATVVAAKADQNITFDALNDANVAAVVSLSATASSGLDVEFMLNGPAVFSGTNVSFTGAGNVSIVASQGGDMNYNAAPSVTNAFRVFSLSRDNGPSAGGNELTIEYPDCGNGSDIGDVLVGGVSAFIVTQTADSVVVLVPASTEAGQVDIVIQSASAGETTIAGGYVYNPVGSIGAIVPASTCARQRLKTTGTARRLLWPR